MHSHLAKGAAQQASGQQQQQQQQHVPEPKQQGAEQRLKQQQEEQQQQQVEQSSAQAVPEPVQRLKNCKLLHSNPGKRVWECPEFCGRPCLIKQLDHAAAKHPILDRKLTRKPCQQDVAGMCRARKAGVLTPTPYHINLDHNLVYCERVEGETLQQRLSEAQQLDEGVEQLVCELGRVLAVLHNSGVVHGALSCSCVLVRNTDQALVLEGFECSTSSTFPRDKASDLVLLEADLQQQHSNLPGLFDKVAASYNKHHKQWSAVHNRLPEARNVLLKHQQGKSYKKQKTK